METQMTTNKKQIFTNSFVPIRVLLFVLICASSFVLIGVEAASAAVRLSMPPNFLRTDGGLAGHWTFDGTKVSGTTVTDSSGNGFTGTLTGVATTTLTNNLQAFWELEEASGTRADRHSTNQLTDNNTVTSNPGKVGTAGQFTSANSEYLTRADNASLSTGDIDFTFAAWLYADTLPGTTMYAVTKWSWDASLNEYTIVMLSSNKLRFQVRSSSAYGIAEWGSTASTGTWYFVVGWHDSVNNVVGISVNDGTPVTVAHTTGVQDTTTPFGIGQNGELTEYWNGRIDQVGFWKRTLTTAEKTALYNNGNGLSYDEMTLQGVGPGKVSQALQFDGATDYVSVADNATLDATDTADLTLTGWFYRDTATTDDTIIAKRNGVASTDTGYIAYIDDADDKLYFEVSDGTDEYQLASASTFTKPGWNHYAIVWDQDSASGSEIYINGVADGATDTGTIGDIGDLSNAVVLAIGAESDAANYFDGRLDDIRVYSRALSASEILQLSKAGTAKVTMNQNSKVTSGLVGLWSFNGPDVNWGTNKALDRSGNSNDGTLTNMATSTSPVPGKIGQALTFDGSNDYVQIQSGHLVSTNNWSVSEWIKQTSDTATFDYFWLNGDDISGGGVSGFHFNTNTSEFLRIDVVTGTDTEETSLLSTAAISLNTWYHIAVVKNGTSLTLYINGVLNNSSTLSSATMDYTANNPQTRIGTRSDALGNFPGLIDEVRVYNRALTAAEVLQLYNVSKTSL